MLKTLLCNCLPNGGAYVGEDYFLIHNLDILYRNCIRLKPIDEDRLKIPLFLYLIVHGELYNAISSYFRFHKSISFRCMRSALDCAFTSYYLLKKPEKLNVYLRGLSEDKNKKVEREWQEIFFNIKRTIKTNKKDFPLAQNLLETHELCSIYCHSDALGILHRYYEDRERSMLEAKYFDYETKPNDFHRWLGLVLSTYYNILLIYWNEIFIHRAGDKMLVIKDNMKVFQEKLTGYIKKYPLDI